MARILFMIVVPLLFASITLVVAAGRPDGRRVVRKQSLLPRLDGASRRSASSRVDRQTSEKF